MSEAVEVNVFNELVKKDPNFLAAAPQQLQVLSFTGQAALRAYRALLDKLPAEGELAARRERTLRDAQDMAEMVLAIDTKLGEHYRALDKTPVERGQDGKYTGVAAGTTSAKKQFVADTGISKTVALQAAKLAEHPEVVAEVVAKARESGDVPTKERAIKEIRRRFPMAKPVSNAGTQIAAELDYLAGLDEALRHIPNNPPKEISEGGYQAMKRKWLVIRKRGEKF